MLHELTRLRAEYLEMPGLRLTQEQVQRLCGLERTVCERVLDALVDARFLYRKADGTYARLTEGGSSTTMPIAARC
jgi:DNA-binding IclR family transcriptional regulator